MIFVRLAVRSLSARWLTVSLTVLAIALSVALFLGVEKLRTGAKASFTDTISGTDLIVGARSGSVQLLLYSVFRIGNATNNVTWESFEDIREMPGVAWAVPLSLGDSHRGFRVLGTNKDYFDRYLYRGGKRLEFASGAPFDDVFDTVLGADVADALGYRLGDSIIVSHGIASFTHHDDKPFRVAGILAKTGTPVDRTVIVSLEGIEAIHIDWSGGGRSADRITADQARILDLSPKAITAAMVGVESKLRIFALQRAINDYEEEPLLAVLPGVALQELWAVVGVAETALLGVSLMVVATALIGMAAMIFAGLNERRREMAILRSVGAAGPGLIMTMLIAEAALIAAAGAGFGVVFLYAGLAALRPWLDSAYGIYIAPTGMGAREAMTLAAAVGAGAVAGLAPAARAYFISLSDGMSVKM